MNQKIDSSDKLMPTEISHMWFSKWLEIKQWSNKQRVLQKPWTKILSF